MIRRLLPLLAFSLTSCGLHPLYGGGSGSTVATTLRSVEVAPIERGNLPALNGAKANTAEIDQFAKLAKDSGDLVFVANTDGWWKPVMNPPSPPLDYAVFSPTAGPVLIRQQDAVKMRWDVNANKMVPHDGTQRVTPQVGGRHDQIVDANKMVPAGAAPVKLTAYQEDALVRPRRTGASC